MVGPHGIIEFETGWFQEKTDLQQAQSKPFRTGQMVSYSLEIRQSPKLQPRTCKRL